MPLANVPPSWQVWLENAQGYEKAGMGNSGKPSRLSPSIQYNLVALALENYVMAMTSFHGTLPENHTFTDLIRAWEQVAPLDRDLKTAILQYEDMQSICSLDAYKRHEPTVQQIDELRGAVKILGTIVKQTCDGLPTDQKERI